jgi:hypothetical protein
VINSIILSPKNYKVRFGTNNSSHACVIMENNNQVIYYRGKPTTRVRLHELYHYNNNHVLKLAKHFDWKSYVYAELSAEFYAETATRGNTEVQYIPIASLLKRMIDYKCHLSPAVSIITETLAQLGYPVAAKTIRSELYWLGREYLEQYTALKETSK